MPRPGSALKDSRTLTVGGGKNFSVENCGKDDDDGFCAFSKDCELLNRAIPGDSGPFRGFSKDPCLP